MGYPPGWVEEAFDTDSNLALFDSDGNALANAAKKETKINPEKIIEYPGFNAPMDKNLKDVKSKIYIFPNALTLLLAFRNIKCTERLNIRNI